MSTSMRILEMPKRPDARLVAELAQMATSHLSDSMEGLYAAGPQLRPMHKEGKLAGPAYTVKTAAGDNLLVQKALDSAQRGDVIVVDAGGFLDSAIIGEMMMARARRRGVAGLVIWGAIRDSAEIGAGSYPVFAAGVTHRKPTRNGPGEINVPVVLGGLVVNAGDIIVGDADGLVAIPLGQAATILAAAKAILARETVARKQIQDGTEDRTWIDKALKEKGYIVRDESKKETAQFELSSH
jgi:RraA family protein